VPNWIDIKVWREMPGSDRVALVTGAGSGIGQAAAYELGRRGYAVVATDVDADAARATAAELGDALALELDVTDLASVEAGVHAALDRHERIDVLVNNAGIGSTDTVVRTAPEQWEQVFAVNVRGVFNCCRSVLPGMLARRAGAIVNTASVAGLVGIPSRAAYCASKGAVVALTKAIAVDHVKDGIRVNCVCPGTVDSPWVGRLIAAADDPEAHRRALEERQPMGRLGTPDEVAKAIAYLAGDDAAFITGTALILDGGWTAA
jgi:2-keto-3-deoxy-L-fuconate dehydrogenase